MRVVPFTKLCRILNHIRLRRELAICTKRKDELEKELSASKDALVELEGRTNARNEALLEADQIKLELSGDITV